MDSEEFSYESEDNYEGENDNVNTKISLKKDTNQETSEDEAKELYQTEIFDLIMRKEYDIEQTTKIDYSRLDEESRELVMEEIIENMIGYAMKKSGYIIGWYPNEYAEYLRESRLSGYISEEKYNGIISLIEDCLKNPDISVSDKIESLAIFTDSPISTLNDIIIVAWHPAIGIRVPVINLIN